MDPRRTGLPLDDPDPTVAADRPGHSDNPAHRGDDPPAGPAFTSPGAAPSTPRSRWAQWWTRLRDGTATSHHEPLSPGDSLVEHIPWERLTVDADPRPSWTTYVAGAIVVALAAGVIFFFRSTSTEPPPLTLDPPSVTQTDAADLMSTATTVSEIGSSSTEAAQGTVQGAAPLVAEADLLAYVPVPGAAAARVRAEWFVLDYFTTTDAQRSEKLSRAAADGLEIPPPPEATTYVDWVRAFAALPDDTGFVVTVLYRTLVSNGDAFQTGRVRAVEIPVHVEADGASAVLDLPSPVAVPSAAVVPAVPASMVPGTPPEAATAQALEWVEGLFDEVSVVGGATDGHGWRLVVEAVDEFDVTWPFVMSVGAGGAQEGDRGGQSGK